MLIIIRLAGRGCVTRSHILLGRLASSEFCFFSWALAFERASLLHYREPLVLLAAAAVAAKTSQRSTAPTQIRTWSSWNRDRRPFLFIEFALLFGSSVLLLASSPRPQTELTTRLATSRGTGSDFSYTEICVSAREMVAWQLWQQRVL